VSVAQVKATVERLARQAFGKLVAQTARATGDIHLAEDLFADALAAALESWPVSGVPDNPEAWLATVARRRAIDVQRTARRHAALLAANPDSIGADHMSLDDCQNRDDRLAMMFVCAHPAIDAAVRTPLMLQVLLGLDAARIAQTYLIPPATLGQRLVRAKAKIKHAGISFDLDSGIVESRAPAVLDAIYAAYTLEHAGQGPVVNSHPLQSEALWLADVCTKTLPRLAEAHGLKALLCLCIGRHANLPQTFVPHIQQDPSAWNGDLIDVGERHLRAAAELAQPGRFQLEAAIQSAHIDAARHGTDHRRAILDLYDALITIAPSAGALVGKAAALLASGDAKGAIVLLEETRSDHLARYQPYWAVMAHALRKQGRMQDARDAFTAAIELACRPQDRAYLANELAKLNTLPEH
jgi:RNA polymerase sigma-70 factor (ECF subfamily)